MHGHFAEFRFDEAHGEDTISVCCNTEAGRNGLTVLERCTFVFVRVPVAFLSASCRTESPSANNTHTHRQETALLLERIHRESNVPPELDGRIRSR